MKSKQILAALFDRLDEKAVTIDRLSEEVIVLESDTAVLENDLEAVTAERDALVKQVETMRDNTVKVFNEGFDAALDGVTDVMKARGAEIKFTRINTVPSDIYFGSAINQLFSGGNR